MLRAKPSMPMSWASFMSFVQSSCVYDATIPTYHEIPVKPMQTSLGDRAYDEMRKDVFRGVALDELDLIRGNGNAGAYNGYHECGD